jgi:hypothetical protein
MTMISKPGIYLMANGGKADVRYVDGENAFGYHVCGVEAWEVWESATGVAVMNGVSCSIVDKW